MDPHSTRSQFNQRAPKAGPQSRLIIDKKSSLIDSPNSRRSTKKSQAAMSSSLTFAPRPIATNSRVKQEQSLKRDIYLSFVANALEQKTKGVSEPFDELVAQFSLTSSSSSSPSTSKSNSNGQKPVPEPIDTAQLRLWLLALSHVVSRLERVHSSLVDAIVSMPWVTLDNATVKSYTVFIGMLASARPEYLSLILAKIAHGFTYQSGIQSLNTNIPSTSSAPLTRRIIYDRLHFLLQHLLTLIPTLPSTLRPMLIRHFPHKRQNQLSQITYIRNLLRLSDYCPELAETLLATIVDRAIQIDVEIQIELEELEEQEEDGLDVLDVFELDPFDIVLGQEPDQSSDVDSGSDDSDSDLEGDVFSDLSSDAGGDFDDSNKARNELMTNVKHIQEMIKKLDAILLLLFEHFDQTHKSSDSTIVNKPSSVSALELPPLPPLDSFKPTSSTISLPQTVAALSQPPRSASAPPKSRRVTPQSNFRNQFHALLSIFDRIILRTFKSRYTQFLLFWYTSLDPEFADVFQGMLVDRALFGSSGPQNSAPSIDGTSGSSSSLHAATPELIRAAAASYIGSFVSRATFVDKEGARRVIGVLCDYLGAHLEEVEQALRAELDTTHLSYSSNPINTVLAPAQHAVFYAVAQAVFLIFCFRWRDLMVEEIVEDELEFELDLDLSGPGQRSGPNAGPKDKWIPELSILKRVVSSVLNPLRVCSQNVVMQFARIAQATDFVYCYTVLETNKRGDGDSISAASTSNTPKTTYLNPEPINKDLNTFFPFDPYRLPRSASFIQHIYREWSSVELEVDDDDDDDEDGEDGEAFEESSIGLPSSSPLTDGHGYLDIPGSKKRKDAGTDDDDGGLGQSLIAMSISPIRMSVSVDMR